MKASFAAFHKIKTKNGDYLCYYMMCLSRQSTPRAELEITFDGRCFVPLQDTPNGEVSGDESAGASTLIETE